MFVHGLGRFDAIFHPAVMDLQASQIKPPHIQAEFIPGEGPETAILPAYMHYVTGMDVQEANENIHLFVNDVLFHLDSEGPYSIDKFGTFSRSASDVLHFTPDWDAFNLTFSGLEIIDLHPDPVKLSTPAYQNKEERVQHDEEYIPEIKEAPRPIDPIGVIEPVSPPHDESVPEMIEETSVTARSGVNESTTRLAWVILTSSLILITILCAYLAWDIISGRQRINQLVQRAQDTLVITNEFDIPIKIDTVMTQAPPVEETTIVKESPDVTPTPTDTKPDTVKNPVEQQPLEKPCFIVVGAFTNEENVTKMLDRLQRLGYNGEKIKGGTLTRVAISTPCDKNTLQKVLTEARASINPEAWVY